MEIRLFNILPESNEKFKKYEKLKDVPLTYFLAFISYALILFIERVAFDCHSLVKNHHHNHEIMMRKRDKKEIKKKNVKDTQAQLTLKMIQ